MGPFLNCLRLNRPDSSRTSVVPKPFSRTATSTRDTLTRALADLFFPSDERGTVRLQGIPASYLIFSEKISSAKRFTPNSGGSEKVCFAFSGGYPADAGCRQAGEIRLAKSITWRIAGEVVSSDDCIRKNPQRKLATVAIRSGTLWRHRNSGGAGTFAALAYL
jgi:hypothetical protein